MARGGWYEAFEEFVDFYNGAGSFARWPPARREAFHAVKPCRRRTTARSGEARGRFARGEIEVAVVAAESLREDIAKSVNKRICIAVDEIAPGNEDDGGVRVARSVRLPMPSRYWSGCCPRRTGRCLPTESDTTRWCVSVLGRRPARSEKYQGPGPH